MKKNAVRLFALACIFFYSSSYSQTNKHAPAELPIDFLNWSNSLSAIKGYKTIKNGTKFKVKISNINKSLWTITDSTKQVSYNTDMPDIFKGIKLPSYLNLQVPPYSGQAAAAAPAVGTPSLQQINQDFDIITTSGKILSDAVLLNNDFKNLYGLCDQTYASIEAQLIARVQQFLATAGATRSTQVAALRAYLQQTANNSIGALNRLKNGIPLYISSQNEKIFNSLAGEIWDWKNLPPKKTDVAAFRISGVAAQKSENTNERIKNQIAELKASLSEAEATVNEIRKYLDDNKVEELITNYSMINESNFTYYTDEMEVKEDEVDVNILIAASKPLACNMPSKNKLETKFRTYNGIKVDFSTGVFGMWGSEDFLGRDLYYKPVDSTTVTIKAKDGGKRMALGIGGLMHVYWRTGGNVNVALSPGISTTTDFDAVNFHLGLSLLTGGKNRIAFTGGLTFRQSKILDREYQLDQSYPKASLPETPPTIKVFPKLGGFVALTYNWSRLKKQ